MKFMNDPAIQQMIHVRGRNIPGLNFYPEKQGTVLYCTVLYWGWHRGHCNSWCVCYFFIMKSFTLRSSSLLFIPSSHSHSLLFYSLLFIILLSFYSFLLTLLPFLLPDRVQASPQSWHQILRGDGRGDQRWGRGGILCSWSLGRVQRQHCETYCHWLVRAYTCMNDIYDQAHVGSKYCNHYYMTVRMMIEAGLRHSTLLTLLTPFHSPLLSSLDNFSTAIDRTKGSQLTRRCPLCPPCSMCHSTSESCYTGECAVGSSHFFPLCNPRSLTLLGWLARCFTIDHLQHRNSLNSFLSSLIISYIIFSHLIISYLTLSHLFLYHHALSSFTIQWWVWLEHEHHRHFKNTREEHVVRKVSNLFSSSASLTCSSSFLPSFSFYHSIFHSFKYVVLCVKNVLMMKITSCI